MRYHREANITFIESALSLFPFGQFHYQSQYKVRKFAFNLTKKARSFTMRKHSESDRVQMFNKKPMPPVNALSDLYCTIPVTVVHRGPN